MIKQKLNESVILSENRDGEEFRIELEIHYINRSWTITPIASKDDSFYFKNTTNYNAGIAIGNLIKEATLIAKNKLGIIEDVYPF